MKKTWVLASLVGLFMLVGLGFSGDVAKKHPNLNAAQKLIQQATAKIEAAQKANEFDLDGHAKKAKELLEQASAELKLAAEAADKKNK